MKFSYRIFWRCCCCAVANLTSNLRQREAGSDLNSSGQFQKRGTRSNCGCYFHLGNNVVVREEFLKSHEIPVAGPSSLEGNTKSTNLQWCRFQKEKQVEVQAALLLFRFFFFPMTFPALLFLRTD